MNGWKIGQTVQQGKTLYFIFRTRKGADGSPKTEYQKEMFAYEFQAYNKLKELNAQSAFEDL